MCSRDSVVIPSRQQGGPGTAAPPDFAPASPVVGARPASNCHRAVNSQEGLVLPGEAIAPTRMSVGHHGRLRPVTPFAGRPVPKSRNDDTFKVTVPTGHDYRLAVMKPLR